jgi:hypothetical protein
MLLFWFDQHILLFGYASYKPLLVRVNNLLFLKNLWLCNQTCQKLFLFIIASFYTSKLVTFVAKNTQWKISLCYHDEVELGEVAHPFSFRLYVYIMALKRSFSYLFKTPHRVLLLLKVPNICHCVKLSSISSCLEALPPGPW